MAYFYESHEHTAKMEELFSKEIKNCINNTSIYRVMSDFNPTNIDITVLMNVVNNLQKKLTSVHFQKLKKNMMNVVNFHPIIIKYKN